GAEPQLIQEPERAGMYSVAAEIAQEIPVLLQDRDLHAGPGQQQPEDHSGRPAAHHTACRPPLHPPIIPPVVTLTARPDAGNDRLSHGVRAETRSCHRGDVADGQRRQVRAERRGIVGEPEWLKYWRTHQVAYIAPHNDHWDSELVGGEYLPGAL